MVMTIKPCKIFYCKNLHYEIGFTNITQEKSGTYFLQNNQTASKYCVIISEE